MLLVVNQGLAGTCSVTVLNRVEVESDSCGGQISAVTSKHLSHFYTHLVTMYAFLRCGQSSIKQILKLTELHVRIPQTQTFCRSAVHELLGPGLGNSSVGNLADAGPENFHLDSCVRTSYGRNCARVLQFVPFIAPLC